MTLPGFIDKTHLSNTKGRYHETTSFRSRSAERIIPAIADWGPFQRDSCTRFGIRQWSSILWGLKWGEDWEDACADTPAYVEGHQFRGATRCVNNGFNIWGQFDVPDPSCGYCTPGGPTPGGCYNYPCCWDPWQGWGPCQTVCP
jgi:hypothetical protein